MEFLKKFGYDKLLTTYTTAELETPQSPIYTVLNAPIYQIRDLFAHYCAFAQHNKSDKPDMIFATEGGTVLGVLIAIGLTPEQILSRWADGVFDVDHLLFGKRRLPRWMKWAHPKTDGAFHKGERFVKALDELLHDKYFSDEKVGIFGKKHRVTMQDLFSRTNTRLAIGVYSLKTNTPVIIDHTTYPNMPVAEAVMASMAAWPIFTVREWEKEKFVSHSDDPLSMNEILDFYRKYYGKTRANGREVQQVMQLFTVDYIPIGQKDLLLELCYRRPIFNVGNIDQSFRGCVKQYRRNFQITDW